MELTAEQLNQLGINMPSTTKKSKTKDFKVSLPTKSGEVLSIGILKIWNRFDETSVASMLTKLGVSGAIIEKMSDTPTSTSVEF